MPRNGGSRGAGLDPANPTGAVSGTGPGVIDGTPIGLLSTTKLGQVTDGAALQANWNLQRHRFMVGGSADRSRSNYELLQQLGLIDAEHRVFADPDRIDPIYRAAQVQIVGNRFDGTSRTNSAYFNETWSPVSNLHLTLAGRYNHTNVKSQLLTRSAEGTVRLDQIRNRNVIAPVMVVCPSANPTSCPAEPQPVPFDFNGNAANQTRTTDDFTYKSFNPQVGVNWLPISSLNLFANASRGARVPSVVELGCAFDSTPVPIFSNSANPTQLGTRARSLVGPTCTSAHDAVGRSVSAADPCDVG